MRAEDFGVEPICRVLREQGLAVAPRAYRSWKSKPAADRTFSDAAVIAELRRIRTGGPCGRRLPEVLYGRRKMTAWPGRTTFPGISKHTVDRLMASEGMNGLVRGRRTRTTTRAKTDGGLGICSTASSGPSPRTGSGSPTSPNGRAEGDLGEFAAAGRGP